VKAVWYERTGAAPDVLTYGDMPTPVAGPGEVRVRLEASGVNPADVGRHGGSLSRDGIPTGDSEQ
jgi:NADPH2:quinone reductase